MRVKRKKWSIKVLLAFLLTFAGIVNIASINVNDSDGITNTYQLLEDEIMDGKH